MNLKAELDALQRLHPTWLKQSGGRSRLILESLTGQRVAFFGNIDSTKQELGGGFLSPKSRVMLELFSSYARTY